MKALLIVVAVCACSCKPTPPLLFQQPQANSDRIAIDLAVFDDGPFRFSFGTRTITPRLERHPLAKGMLVQGTFGTTGTLVFARINSTISGVVREGNAGFEIVPVRGGHRLVLRSWDPPVRPLHGARWETISAAAGQPPADEPPPPPPSRPSPIVIDVLFAYTPAVLAALALDGIESLAQAATADLNTACTEGNAAVQYHVAGTVATADTELAADGVTRKDLDTIYYELLGKTAYADAHAERKAKHADILVLLIDSVEGGVGAATIMGQPDTAVAVVDHHGLLWYLAIPHEVGHIMGGRHDDDTRDKPFKYGHGYSGKDGRTIMSNVCALPAECPLVVRWSEAPLGDKDWRDNARVVRKTAPAVSKFGDNL